MDGPRLLKEWREGQKLTQEQAAERVGVHQNTWCDWEKLDDAKDKGKRPRVDAAIRIAKLTKGYVPVEAWASGETPTAAKAE